MAAINLDIGDIPDDEPININFSEIGYDSKLFLKNAGSTLLFVILNLVGWFILIFLKFISVLISK